MVHLRKDLTRDIKRGHMWLFADSVDCPRAPSGSYAILIDRNGQKIASGIYDPEHPIVLRICRTAPPWDLSNAWFEGCMSHAQSLRQRSLPSETTGYRLVNGEGDGLPGLIVDVYGDTCVIKLDGGAPQAFYDTREIAHWMSKYVACRCAIERPRQRGSPAIVLLGDHPSGPIDFLECGLKFTADVLCGQKTGFFLDQRDNRQLIRQMARDQTVLNLFSFSGGFSVASGAGGCRHATSVDISPVAIQSANTHWQSNGLAPELHEGVVSDVFEFLDNAARTWEIVICDPPSFAPSEKTKRAALEAYQRLAQMSAKIVAPGGLLALASCSSHIDSDTFEQVNLAGVGRARRRATLIANRSLPIDHPTPFAMPELRYLKFQLLRLA